MSAANPQHQEYDRKRTGGGKELTFGLLCLTTILLLYLPAFHNPFLGSMLGIVSPIPAVVAFSRGGRFTGFLVILAGLVIVSGLYGLQAGLSFLLQVGLFAAILALGLKKGLSPLPLTVTVAGLVLASHLTVAIFTFSGSPLGTVTHMQAELERAMETMSAYTGESPGPEPLHLEKYRQVFLILSPGLIVVGLLINSLFCLVVSRQILSSSLERKRPLTEWKMPDNLIWIYILAGFLAWWKYEAFWAVPVNLIMVLSLLYTVQGLAVGIHLADRHGVKNWIKLLFGLMLLLQPLFFLIFLIIGLIDFRFDFRKGRKEAS